MSGGSYDYLYDKYDCGELLNRTDVIQEMADRLAGLGYASDAARETEELLLTLRQFESRISVMRDRLAGVWKSVEMWDSGDWLEDSVGAALEKYRKNGGKL